MNLTHFKNDRPEFQKYCEDLWFENDCVGSFLLGTGTGKSKIALDCLNRLFNKNQDLRVVIGIPLIRLKEDVWINEMKKWDYDYMIDKVEIHCYQTLRSWKTEKIDLLIGDEIDECISPVNLNLFKNNQIDKRLLLTATAFDEKRTKLEELAPVLLELSREDAQELEFINYSNHWIIEYELSTINNIPVKYPKNGKEQVFYTSEKKQYDYYDNSMKQYGAKLMDRGFKVGANIFKLIGYLKSKKDEQSKAYLTWAYKYSNAMRGRKNILLNNQTSISLTHKLGKDILNGKTGIKDPKILIFSESIEHIEKICKNTIHSNKTLEENKEVIENLSKGKIRAAGACKGLTVGVTIPGVNCGIYAGYFGAKRVLSQRVGRTIRDATADIANNYYLVAKNTQQEEWLKNMLEDIDKEYIKYLDYKQ